MDHIFGVILYQSGFNQERETTQKFEYGKFSINCTRGLLNDGWLVRKKEISK